MSEVDGYFASSESPESDGFCGDAMIGGSTLKSDYDVASVDMYVRLQTALGGSMLGGQPAYRGDNYNIYTRPAGHGSEITCIAPSDPTDQMMINVTRPNSQVRAHLGLVGVNMRRPEVLKLVVRNPLGPDGGPDVEVFGSVQNSEGKTQPVEMSYGQLQNLLAAGLGIGYDHR